MIATYAREFVAIGKFLREHGTCKGEHILVDKDVLKEMMNRNRYDTADNKLKIWKALHWITPEDGRRMTKRVYNPDTGRYDPKIAMDLEVLDMLEQLQERKKAVE